jgi:hypothetical protein
MEAIQVKLVYSGPKDADHLIFPQKNGPVIKSSSVRNKKTKSFFFIFFLHNAFCEKKQ